jgi:hypothetical protein
MSDTQRTLERAFERLDPPRIAFEQLERRRERKHRNQRVAAGVLGIAVFAIAAVGFVRLLGSDEGTPATGARRFAGEWISRTDGIGSTQRMTITVSVQGGVAVVLTDDFAAPCEGSGSRMTGTGRIENATTLVIPDPSYTCEDGGPARNPTGATVNDLLGGWTLSLDAGTDTLTDNVGIVWVREGADAPSPAPAASGQMWPQSSYQEVVEAQQLADAGDPRYPWQVDRNLASTDNLYPWDSEIVERFLREGLGWEDWAVPSGVFAGSPGDAYNEIMLIRCAPGRTNPLYPEMPTSVRGCAPTIDDFRYETVKIDLGQPGLPGPTGLWVITGWELLQPVEPQSLYDHLYPQEGSGQVVQVAPPSDAEVNALVKSFLDARVNGAGAEQYVHRHLNAWDDQEVPLMYATTSGSPYERYEIDRVQGPVWPTGWIGFRIHLFAKDGTEVAQSFVVVRQEDGALGVMYDTHTGGSLDLPTTENGEPLPVPYTFLDGEVTFDVATPDLWDEPWDGDLGDLSRFMLFGLDRSSMMFIADPAPVDAGCEPGLAPADAAALAASIRSNPDVDSTAPVALRLGGIDALRMDVAFGPGAGCRELGVGPAIVGGAGYFEGNRGVMRLYLVDLPAGMSARVLGIAIVAPDRDLLCDPGSTPCFRRVMEAVAPVLDSLELHEG